MPEVVKGSRSRSQQQDGRDGILDTPTSPTVPPLSPSESTHPRNPSTSMHTSDTAPLSPLHPPNVHFTDETMRMDSNRSRTMSEGSMSGNRRKSLSYDQRPQAPAYYDSRAGSKKEYRRRASTLQEYYDDNPHLLPQLPFTWHHGKKRWRLGALIFLMFVDACVLPIVLYYAMRYAGNVEGWIIFAIVTTIWGGPTYLEFGIRTLRLIKKERFYRPLHTNSRWCFDCTTWTSVITITAVTALFIVGSAPHIVWLRVLCMPGPAILFCLGGVIGIQTLYSMMNWKAPFAISSTRKGDVVNPGAYYLMEDVVAVNAGAGRPYREAIAARYKASPRFRKMLLNQSLFWSIPALIIAIPLTVIAVIHDVPATVAYGICWALPFIWAIVWGFISTYWVKRDLRLEREEWEADQGSLATKKQHELEA